MWTPAPEIFPLFRSRITAAVLTRLFVGDDEYSIAELAKMAMTDSGTMTREVRRLEGAGVTKSRTVGRTKLVRANHEAPFYRALRDLVVITMGPADVLATELRGMNGIEGGAIFGSWAARAAGKAGPSPADIDLLVIGRPDRDDLHDAVRRAQARLGREINPVVVSRASWVSREDPFLAELQESPLAALPGIPEPVDLEVAR